MDQTGQELLKLMFKPGETICVSPNKYGYHSIPLENAFSGKVTLVPTGEREIEYVDSDNLTLVALNPIKGWRDDESCMAFRSFLVEMDTGPLDQQLAYIKKLGLPYSAVIFSGNKSLHFLVTIDTNLQRENAYRHIAEWILKICTLADQKTKNPSRSIRIPGAIRDLNKKQELVEFRGVTKLADLVKWLNEHPEAKPKIYEKRTATEKVNTFGVKKWAVDELNRGITSNRNQRWYAVAYEYALSGYSENATIAILEKSFVPDRDFKEREWKMCITSAFKRVHGKR